MMTKHDLFHLFATCVAFGNLAALGAWANPAGFCAPSVASPNVCVFGQPDGQGNVVFTVHSNAAGWVAVGVGSSMSAGVAYIGWKNSTGGTTLSSRQLGGRTLPNPLQTGSKSTATQVPLAIPAPPWATHAFSFSRSITAEGGARALLKTSPYIYAYSDSAPSTINSPTSSFSIHKTFGILNAVDFLSNSSSGLIDAGSGSLVALPAGWTYENVILAHAVIMTIAWIGAPAAGIFVARYLKAALGVWWFRLHIALMLGATTLIGFVGFLLIVLFRPTPHFAEAHERIGLTIIVASFLQTALGFVIDALFDPKRKSIPVLDQIHWWFGRGVILLAIINIILGFFYLKESGYEISFGLFAFTVLLGASSILIFVYGELFYGQRHHAEPKPVASII